MRDRLGHVLAHRRLPWLLPLVSLVPILPALSLGLVGDDYLHRAILEGSDPLFASRDPYAELFTFFPGPEGNAPLIERGVLPWWADPGVKSRFLRPLSAATHVFDYAVFGDLYPLHHAQSLLWLVACIALATSLYRKLMPTAAIAGLAAVLFALEDARATPAAWLANRNALIGLAFGLGALLLHIDWRKSRRASSLAGGLTLGALGLAAGESAVGAWAYIAAWQLTMDGPDWRDRAFGIAPWVALGGAYLILYAALGYGAHGSELYVDPAGAPFRFAAAVAERWPLLMGALWLQLPIDLWNFLERGPQLALVASCVFAVWLVLTPMRRLLQQSPLARFWAAGAALAMIPPCASLPMDRLLVFAGVGAFGLLAMFVDSVFRGVHVHTGAPRGRVSRWAAGTLLFVHGPVALLSLLLHVELLRAGAGLFEAGANAGPDGPEVASQTFVFVTASELPVAYTQVIRRARGSTPPRRVAQLASLASENAVTRIDERTLRIEPRGGFLRSSMDGVARYPRGGFSAGELIARPDFEAHIDSLTPDGRPARVSFRFRSALEDPNLVWLAFLDGKVVPFDLPPIGSTVVLGGGMPQM